MFYLVLAIVTSAMVSVIMRLSGEKVKNNMAMLAVSYMTSTVIALLHTDGLQLTAWHPGLPTALAMAVVNGCLFMAGFVLMQHSIPKNGVVLTSTYMRLGLIVCLALSVLLFRELPSPVQVVGFALAVFAIVLHGGGQGSGSRRAMPALLLLLLLGGLIDIWMKVFGEVLQGALSDLFLLATFVVAALLCLVMKAWKKQRFGWWELLFGAIIAIPNYYNSRFLLLSLQSLPGIVVYPTFSVGTLLLITVLGVCLFRERLSRRQWTAMGIILVALALLNL